uniref:CRISPR type III-associated protein domain-containing protein n=1 Tax=Thermosporothrix sp. COM3 TaxID=2490863 RepID=A0A455SN16_9CHLR|nr:hypothetical protein KTC_35490 [Thermosporothrix sp. COM3]
MQLITLSSTSLPVVINIDILQVKFRSIDREENIRKDAYNHVYSPFAYPSFFAGANQKAAELRAPSFRGQMRYWYRALVAGVEGPENLKALREAEAAVFGSSSLGSAVNPKNTSRGIKKDHRI